MRLPTLCCFAAAVAAVDWAVIVAGSSGYGNYRHQADACHAYQIMHKHGIADENIITMMADDIASAFQNPFKGKVFNKPTKAGTPGEDVYAGCKVDYRGREEGTPANFLAILTGDSSKTGGKPVLNSTANDRVFVNFVDHGGVGIVAFPDGILKNTDLINALKTGHAKNMWSKLVFYMEACESGSMFPDGSLDGLDVYATTAANAHESSWGTYCPPMDMVDGKHMSTCLGDLYSVNWMENTDTVGTDETLEEQFNIVKRETNKSHVLQFGDISFTSEKIGDFFGGKSDGKRKSAGEDTEKTSEREKEAGTVSSRDIPLHLSYYEYLRTPQFDLQARKAAAQALKAQIDARLRADAIFAALTDAYESPQLLAAEPAAPILCGTCCGAVLDAYAKDCGGFDDYSLQYARTVVNLCQLTGDGAGVSTKLSAICAASQAELM